MTSSVSNPYEWEPTVVTTDSAEVERLRIALADAMNAPHTMTVDELVDRARELREKFDRLASRRNRLELLATGYAMGQAHGFARPTLPLSSLSRFVDAALAEDVEISCFQALYERMARGETAPVDLPNAA